MEKPCCCELCDKTVWPFGGMKKDILHSCSNPSCKCHLPKEKCECAEPNHGSNCPMCLGKDGLCHTCGLPIQRETTTDNAVDSPIFVNSPKQPPAPEKKWEARLQELLEDSKRTGLIDLKSFIASILEEKAVEVQDRKAKQISPQKKLTARNEGYNEGLDEAAAILRR